MKANGGIHPGGKDRKRKISSDQASEQDGTKVPQSASRRHREKINATLEELGLLLPLPEEARSKLDKLTILKLSVSFFQTQNYLQSGKRKRRADDAAVNEITKRLEELNINVSDISLEALDSFFLVLSEKGDVFFASENVYGYLGYTQTFLMHQNFLNFVHHEDKIGFERRLRRPSARARIMELDNGRGIDCLEFEEQPIPQVCFSSIKCHAGRQSSHVSPFYYRSFKFDGHIKPLLSGKMKQYGFFALCTPVNPANPFTSTPKELLQLYSCKMGLNLSVRKLDNRGQKSLFYSDKEAFNLTGYMVAHPDDIPGLMLAHQQITATGHCETVFRLKNGQGVFQWVRGKARTLYDKHGKPECITADNVLLNNEQGPYFCKVVYEMLCEWKARQKCLPSPPMSDDDRSSVEESNQDAQLSTGPPGAMLPTGGPTSLGRPCQLSGENPPIGQLPPDRSCPPGGKRPLDGSLPNVVGEPLPLGRPRPLPPSGPLPLGRPLSPVKPVLPAVPLSPSLSVNDIKSGGQGMTGMPEEEVLPDSKDIEIIEYQSSPPTAAESSGHMLPSLGFTTGSSESCMFSTHLPPMEEKPTILHDGTIYNFKTEHRNGGTAHMDSKRNHSAFEQINLIKQFLMGGDSDSLPNVHQTENTVRINGGGSHDITAPWANYPVQTSPVLTEVNFQQDGRCPAPYPPQNGMQSSFHANECRVPGMLQGHANSAQFGGSRQPEAINLIYPFPPDMNNHMNSSNSYANSVDKQNIPELLTSIGAMQNGSDFIPGFLLPEENLHHSFQPRYQTSQNGLYHAETEGGFSTVADPATENRHAHDFMVNASITDIPRQDNSLWFSSPNTAQVAQNMQVPQIEDLLSVDELTPSLCVDHMAPYGNPGQFHNSHTTESVHPANVFPSNGMHLNQTVGQSYQKQNFQRTTGSTGGVDQPLQSSGSSLLKMMLSEQRV